MNIAEEYQNYCEKNKISYFTSGDKVNPYDDTTLFCPSGMQKFKHPFTSEDTKEITVANIQSCIRMNDFDDLK